MRISAIPCCSGRSKSSRLIIRTKPDLATSIAREWIDRQGVEVIVDGGSSAAGLAIQQVTRKKQRIFLIAAPATSDLTGKACSPFGFNFCYDTYALANGTGTALTAEGADSWYFITADYAFGHALERDASAFVKQAGGKVIGSSQYPFGSNDFSSYLLQAQSSGAKAIGLASSGEDLQNLIKQAAEFGIMHGPQRVAALLIFINDVVSLGQSATEGLVLTTSFYWDLNDATRRWTKRFRTQRNRPPSMVQASCYSGLTHYLKAVTAKNTLDASVIAAEMRATPVSDMYNANVEIRADGQVLHTMYLMQVKPPQQARYPDDYYQMISSTPGEKIYRSLAEGGCILPPT